MNREADAPNPICRLDGVHKSFGSHRVLKGVSLDFGESRTTVVMGPSGCGKSVTLKHLVGLLRPDRGSVWFDGQRIDRLRDRDLVPVRRQIGFLFQQGALFDSMTVAENVAFPLIEHSPMSADERAERVDEVLRMVGLADTAPKMPADLSGGQRKRIALARAIVLRPRVILYDEPTTGLDPIRSDLINELILKMQRALDATSIVVTHDLTSAFKVADWMVMLYDGVVVCEGTPDDMRNTDDPLVQRFLRGQASAEDLEAINATETADPGAEPAGSRDA